MYVRVWWCVCVIAYDSSDITLSSVAITYSLSHTLHSHSVLTTYSSSPIHPLLTHSLFTSTLFSTYPYTPFLTPTLISHHSSTSSILLVQVGEDRLIRFSGCKSGSACTIILRGASSHLLDEAERSLHDALCVLTETVKETRCVCVCVEIMFKYFVTLHA